MPRWFSSAILTLKRTLKQNRSAPLLNSKLKRCNIWSKSRRWSRNLKIWSWRSPSTSLMTSWWSIMVIRGDTLMMRCWLHLYRAMICPHWTPINFRIWTWQTYNTIDTMALMMRETKMTWMNTIREATYCYKISFSKISCLTRRYRTHSTRTSWTFLV